MGGSERSRLRLAQLVVVVMAVIAVPVPASAAPEDDLEEAQRQANQAAAELSGAQTALAQAQDAVAAVQARVDGLEARVNAARTQVGALAVRLYVEGTVPIIRILRMENANEVVRAQQYSHVIAGGTTDSLRRFRDEREDLRREQEALQREQASQADSLEALDERRAGAVAELERLTTVVAEAAAARDTERRAAAVAAARAGNSAEGSSADRSTSGLSATPGPAPTSAAASPTAPVTTAAPALPAPADDGAPPADGDSPAPASGDAEWICPVQGPHAFTNDYGAPRGGGFSHEGNDILAARGTPVVASVSGAVRHRSGAVSGLAYYLDGDDGNEYFGAHLDSYGESGTVSAGTIVGYVGNTGDAASTAPHLHFEIHPGGSGNINPYPTLTKYC